MMGFNAVKLLLQGKKKHKSYGKAGQFSIAC